MRVKKTFNNNVLLATSKGTEVIVLGSGIAFNKHPGDEVDTTKIEKIFTASKFFHFNGFLDLIDDIPEIYFQISMKIILLAEKKLSTDFNSSVLIALIDHIHFAVQRKERGIQIQNNFLWEIERIYPKEYQIGRASLKIIEQATQIVLPDDEAGFIALKFVESATDIDHQYTRDLRLIKDIINIIQYQLNSPIDEKSISYQRLVTHLKFLLLRFHDSDKAAGNSDENVSLLTSVSSAYPIAFKVAKKIQVYIQQQLRVLVSANELTFLTIHIERIIQENIKK